MELDIEVLDDKSTTTSLADMYGYSAFSEKFERNLMNRKRNTRKEQDACLYAVFNHEREDTVEMAFERVFAAESMIIIKENYETGSSGGYGIGAMMGFTLLGAVLSMGVWIIIEKIRKEKKLHENYSDSN